MCLSPWRGEQEVSLRGMALEKKGKWRRISVGSAEEMGGQVWAEEGQSEQEQEKQQCCILNLLMEKLPWCKQRVQNAT